MADKQYKNAKDLELLKVDLCKTILKHRNKQNLTQTELAEKLEVNKSRVSEIARYKVDSVSVDRLLGYLWTLGLTLNVKIEEAKLV